LLDLINAVFLVVPDAHPAKTAIHPASAQYKNRRATCLPLLVEHCRIIGSPFLAATLLVWIALCADGKQR
jgi:hypothetical protein